MVILFLALPVAVMFALAEVVEVEVVDVVLFGVRGVILVVELRELKLAVIQVHVGLPIKIAFAVIMIVIVFFQHQFVIFLLIDVLNV